MQLSLDNEVISTQLFQNNYHLPTNLSQYTPNFTSLHTLVTENKPYTPITTCVLQHILTTTHLCDLEKLYYMLADSLSIINHNKGKKRSVTISAIKWAEKLNCSVSEIFSMQKSLEQKGYFKIDRIKDKDGKNKKNTITPTLPDSIFNSLVKTPNRFNIGTYSTDTSLYSNFTSTDYLPNLENKITYLDRTKMFIKLNYDLLLLITSSSYLTKFAKILWLDFYAIGYRYYLKHRNCDNNTTETSQYYAKNTEELFEMLMFTSDNIKTDDYVNYVAPPNSYSLTTTYKELQDKYSCSKQAISKTLKELETKGFITRKRFFVKNDDEDSNLHDKSVWRITVTLPDMIQQHLQNEVKDRAKPASESVVANSDPYVINSSQYINKYFISNTKDLDNIDSEKSFFEKTNDFLPETSSELSEFYKNSLEEERVEKIEEIEEISEIVKEEQEKILLLNQLSEQSDEEEQINVAIENGLVNTTSEISVTNASIVHHKKSSSQAKSLPNNKPSTQATSLKSFYPLSKEQVDKIFLPIGFIDGFMGKLFIEFAWTLAFCVLVSGFVALTLTPMMASRMIGKNDQPSLGFLIKFDQFIKLVQSKYLVYLNLAFDHKKQFSLIIALSLVALVVSFIFVPKVFIPQEDDGLVQISFSSPQGSNSEQSEKAVIEVEKILSSYKDILGYLMMTYPEGSHGFVPLKDWKVRSMSQTTIINLLNKQFQQITGISAFARPHRSLISGNAGHAVEFTLQSSLEYEQLVQISEKFVEAMKKKPAFMNMNVYSNVDFSPIIDVIVNRDKAYLYGVSLENIGLTLQYLLAGKQLGDFRMGNELYDITMQYNLKHRSNIDHFSKILIPTNKPTNNLLPLNVVANIVEKVSIKFYNHYNNARSVTISADLAPNQKITDAIKQVNNIANELLDNNTTILEYIGEIKQKAESEGTMTTTFLFALLFIYLVLSAQFESFTDPILILIAVPFSFTGGVLALWIFGNTFNMYSGIGLLTLIGLITKNSIMIVEFTNNLRSQGLNIREAVTKASSLRLRPILMTTLATIFGAVSLVIASGAGAEAQKSIGLVIVGGMTIGTLFTIFVIPVLYQSFKREIKYS